MRVDPIKTLNEHTRCAIQGNRVPSENACPPVPPFFLSAVFHGRPSRTAHSPSGQVLIKRQEAAWLFLWSEACSGSPIESRDPNEPRGGLGCIPLTKRSL